MNTIQMSFSRELQLYPIEVMVTLRFYYTNYSDEKVRRMATEFIMRLSLHRKIQVAGFGVVNRRKRLHVHLALFGCKKTIFDLKTKEADRLWKYGIAYVSDDKHGNEEVEGRMKTIEGISDYLARNLTPNNPASLYTFYYNRRKLEKSRFDRKKPNMFPPKPHWSVPLKTSLKRNNSIG